MYFNEKIIPVKVSNADANIKICDLGKTLIQDTNFLIRNNFAVSNQRGMNDDNAFFCDRFLDRGHATFP